MMFVTMEDEFGVLEGVLFPRACGRSEGALREPGPYLFEGEVESEHGVASLSIRRIEPLPPPLDPGRTG